MELLLHDLIAQGWKGMRETDKMFMAIAYRYNLNNVVESPCTKLWSLNCAVQFYSNTLWFDYSFTV